MRGKKWLVEPFHNRSSLSTQSHMRTQRTSLPHRPLAGDDTQNAGRSRTHAVLQGIDSRASWAWRHPCLLYRRPTWA